MPWGKGNTGSLINSLRLPTAPPTGTGSLRPSRPVSLAPQSTSIDEGNVSTWPPMPNLATARQMISFLDMNRISNITQNWKHISRGHYNFNVPGTQEIDKKSYFTDTVWSQLIQLLSKTIQGPHEAIRLSHMGRIMVFYDAERVVGKSGNHQECSMVQMIVGPLRDARTTISIITAFPVAGVKGSPLPNISGPYPHNYPLNQG